MESLEKKINKFLIDFIIGSAITPERSYERLEKLKKRIFEAYDHLKLEYLKIKKIFQEIQKKYETK
jgi:hypothetical protein